MNQFEKYSASGPEEESFSAEQTSTLDRFGQEERGAFEKFLQSIPKTSVSRLKKVSKYIAIFGLATATLQDGGHTSSEMTDQYSSAKLSPLQLRAPASPSEIDNATKNLLKTVLENTNSAYAGPIIYGNITAYDESGSFDGAKKNDSAFANENLRGELPERAEKILIRGGLHTVTETGQTNSLAGMSSGTRSAFALTGIAPGFDVVPAGEAQDFKGFGASKKDALQNGLEGAVGFFGKTINTESNLKAEAKDSSTSASLGESFRENIESSYGQALHSYSLSTVKQRPDGMWEANIKIVPGKIIQTGEPNSVEFKPKPLD